MIHRRRLQRLEFWAPCLRGIVVCGIVIFLIEPEIARTQTLCTLEVTKTGYLLHSGSDLPVIAGTVCGGPLLCEGTCNVYPRACPCVKTDSNGRFQVVDTMYQTVRNDTTTFGRSEILGARVGCGDPKCVTISSWDGWDMPCPPPYFLRSTFQGNVYISATTPPQLESIEMAYQPFYNGVGRDFQFYWSSVPGATSYRLQIDSSDLHIYSFFGQLWMDTTVTTSAVIVEDLPGVVRWRVRAQNGCTTSAWTYTELYAEVELEHDSQTIKPTPLTANYPNPFNSSTVIRFNLEVVSDWSVTIYNILGQTLRSYSGSQAEGAQLIEWHGDDGIGKPMPSGMYFYRVETSRWSTSRKMVLLR